MQVIGFPSAVFGTNCYVVATGPGQECVIVDPGIGFGKTPEQNWQLLGHLPQIASLGHGVLVGASRKRFLAGVLPEDAGIEARDLPTSLAYWRSPPP